MIIRFEKTKDGAITPRHSHFDDAGYDIFLPENFNDGIDKMWIRHQSTVMIKVGLKLFIPQGYMGLMMPRSSSSLNGLISEIPPIDAGYRGEISCIIHNNNKDKDILVHGKDRLCQLVFVPIATPQLMDINEFNKLPKRNGGGFGSTGK